MTDQVQPETRSQAWRVIAWKRYSTTRGRPFLRPDAPGGKAELEAQRLPQALDEARGLAARVVGAADEGAGRGQVEIARRLAADLFRARQLLVGAAVEAVHAQRLGVPRGQVGQFLAEDRIVLVAVLHQEEVPLGPVPGQRVADHAPVRGDPAAGTEVEEARDLGGRL